MSLKRFVRRIQLLGQRVEENTDQLVKDVAIAVDQTVVLATPVDTGRARANWRAAIGTPIMEDSEETDPSGSSTINQNNSVIRGRKNDQTIFISNNLPYIGELNRGSSSQAPAMFVEQAVQTGVNAIKRARLTRR